ncbi:MAG: hypothetical protein ABIH71_05050 [Candidatus Omnitrophota bacterium]|nr:hypothetical protein [Candidatus Omnitrophota bacterium]
MSKAIVLFSSGLDSILAVKIAQNQGVEVIALYFIVPFTQGKSLREFAPAVKASAAMLGVDLKIVRLGQDYLEIIRKPNYGYGKNLNPCVDCKIFMYKKAERLMREMGASFIITGEVAGQRPKSQSRQIFAMMDKRAGVEGLILRPLSAKILPPTFVEQEKVVNRNKLYDIYGRGRSAQIELAKIFGIDKYPQPSGGCLLTDASFCGRVEDLIKHNELNMENVGLLKLGRHFRLTPFAKLIAGRDEEENNRLKKLLKKDDLYFETINLPGPAGLGRGLFSENEKLQAAGIIAQYTSTDRPVKVKLKEEKREKIILVKGPGPRQREQLIL